MGRIRFINKDTEKYRAKKKPIGRRWKRCFYISLVCNIIALAHYLTTII
jgi:hypothetical protein